MSSCEQGNDYYKECLLNLGLFKKKAKNAKSTQSDSTLPAYLIIMKSDKSAGQNDKLMVGLRVNCSLP